ncbi:MAG: amidohydrolase [Solirubrobacterales bacterium]|nr:amidohydrolase [Solirubrobacterales bacterium]
MTIAPPQPSTPGSGGPRQGPLFIDTDIHERADTYALVPYLEPKWQKYITDYDWQPDRLLGYSQPTAGGLDRKDAKVDGKPGGSSLKMLQEQVLDEYNVEYGILTGWLNASALQSGWPEFKTALMSAYNDWELETWVEKDDRLMGSIHVNAWDPEGAAREIDRLGGHPRFVQAMLYMYDQPFGDPRYHAIFEAAERNNLVVGMHHSENTPTALGFHRYFAEWHTLIPQAFMSQAVSLVFNGVFNKYPNLKVNLIEGGFSFLPHLMWHADQQWRELRNEVPWIKRAPSEIMREHLRFATQPIEDFTLEEFLRLIDQIGSEDMVCFSTDYPHWDFDSPLEALPQGLPEELSRKIFYENARATYTKLPAAVAKETV